MKEKLQEYALIAEIVGAIAVVISLIYVGVGVRENTAAVSSSTAQSVTNSSSELLLTIVANEDLAKLRRMGRDDYSSLDYYQQDRFINLTRQQWIHLQNIFLQNKLGVLDETVWITYRNIICSEIKVPGMRETWPIHAAVLSPEFVSMVESCPGFEK